MIDDSMIARLLEQCDLNDAVPTVYREELKQFARACYAAGRDDEKFDSIRSIANLAKQGEHPLISNT